jgi:hypothetical protein
VNRFLKFAGILASGMWLLLTPARAAERWKIQYFFDDPRDTFAIEDLAFSSAQRGIAVGEIHEELNPAAHQRHVALLTSDGGQHWTLEPLKDRPRSLFFLNESTGWMVTDNGLWFTEESGHNWKKISDQPKPDHKLGPTPPGGLITRIWFLDAQHGYAVGLQKTALETRDGGRTWTPIEEAAKPSANPAHTVYSQIAFEGSKVGIIVGSSTPPRPDDLRVPAWVDPNRAAKRSQVPTLTLELQTLNGGEKWASSTAPLFGNVVGLRLAGPDGLTMFGFNEAFEWPSEVYHLDLHTGQSTRVFREKDRRLTDCALFPGPRGFLAGVEPPGKLNSVPIPGKVKILFSSNLTDWTEMDVDYKANARSLVLAGPDAQNQWAATDTGMILHLVP